MKLYVSALSLFSYIAGVFARRSVEKGNRRRGSLIAISKGTGEWPEFVMNFYFTELIYNVDSRTSLE